ncbi:hypothetical protein EUTSA_v10013736mg [Eutrema salsugineum]|uniref:CBM20 domain-containing protein n=2 Tax=Eutrema salsugineum TaxID=72664 RepID=V4L8Y2_EUTSA|nr:hypothetical protein EUTSA_v10013736mg [Eutrema salsugineum]
MTGTLTSSSPSSSTKIVLEDFSATNFRRATEIFPSVLMKTSHLKFLRLDSVQSRILKPILLRSSLIKVSQENREAAEIEAVEKSSATKTVRVSFQLRRECVFGEHFFILGDDPVFGVPWDPENALPLSWSDGHVWTVDLDLPVGRLVEFKFILKAKTGEILWQPGPNRALQTWETNKTIRLCEDWENADLQMMIEEDFVPLIPGENQPSAVNFDMPIVAKDEEHVLGTVQEKSSEAVVVNVGYISDDSDENLSSNPQSEKTMETSNGALTALGEKDTMITEEEDPVLVPGLIPLYDLENEEVKEPISQVSVEAINEGKAQTFPEVGKKEEIKMEKNEKGKVKAIKGVEKMLYNASKEEMQQQRLETESLETPNVLLEKDIQWGRKTLYKLLSNFGLF